MECEPFDCQIPESTETEKPNSRSEGFGSMELSKRLRFSTTSVFY